jgi:hypothetical protein
VRLCCYLRFHDDSCTTVQYHTLASQLDVTFHCSIAAKCVLLHPVRMGPSAAAAQRALINCFETAVHRAVTALPAPYEAGAVPTAAQVPCL